MIRRQRFRLVVLLVLVGTFAFAASAGADPAPPVVTFTQAPPDPTNQTSATFTFTADQPNTTFKCSVDGAEPTDCSSPPSVTIDALTEGPHTFTVTATNPANETGSATHSWTVDLTPPAVAITSGPTASSGSKVAIFEFGSDTDANATFRCAVDADALADCTSPYTTLELADGPHTFTLEARDAAGNTATTTYQWTIDTKAPVVAITSQPQGSTTDTGATFTFDVDEPAAAQCSLDGSAFAACASPATYSALGPGSHSFVVQAVDAAGNTGSASYSWAISPLAVVEIPTGRDTTPPETADPLDYLVGYRYFELNWTLPPDVDFAHATVFRRATGGSRVAVYSGAGPTYRDPKFNNALDYRYDVVTFDQTGNASPAVTISITSSALLASPRRGARVRRPPTLAWASISRARFYNVQLFRNGRKIMSTWPRRSRVHLAPRWHYGKRAYALSPGRYDWYVWPAFRSGSSVRYGQALGHSFFRR